MSDLNERLDALRVLVDSPEFLEGKGLSNEVNIRIFCYEPKEEMKVRHFVEKLVVDQSISCHIIEFNLYQVFLSICDDKRITDKIPAQEEKKGKQFILDQMTKLANNTAFINKMKQTSHQQGAVILLTGVGEVFPFMRIHSLLEAIQPHFSDVPILVMYPGKYDGHYVKLFDLLPANPYYRAFNLI